MTISMSVALRNARLNAIETLIGTSAVIKIRTGPKPGIANADSGDVLATLNLPSNWMAAAAAGVVDLTGTWEDISADASGVAGHWRMYASDGTTQHMEGTISATGLGGDMTMANTTLVAGQGVLITLFRLTEGNA